MVPSSKTPPVPEVLLQRSAPLRFAATTPRARLLWIVAAYCCAISFITRVALIVKAHGADQLAFSELPRVVLTGFAYDAITSLYFIAPLAAYFALAPSR